MRDDDDRQLSLNYEYFDSFYSMVKRIRSDDKIDVAQSNKFLYIFMLGEINNKQGKEN